MTAAPTPQQPKLSLPELQNIFKIKFGKDVPTNKKNDRDRIYSKLYTQMQSTYISLVDIKRQLNITDTESDSLLDNLL